MLLVKLNIKDVSPKSLIHGEVWISMLQVL
jgi:hypothetical protein